MLQARWCRYGGRGVGGQMERAAGMHGRGVPHGTQRAHAVCLCKGQLLEMRAGDGREGAAPLRLPRVACFPPASVPLSTQQQHQQQQGTDVCACMPLHQSSPGAPSLPPSGSAGPRASGLALVPRPRGSCLQLVVRVCAHAEPVRARLAHHPQHLPRGEAGGGGHAKQVGGGGQVGGWGGG